MVDIDARKKAAEIARRFVSGQITNFDFEKNFPCSKDPAIWAIEDTIWCFYEDFKEHKLKDKWKISGSTKEIMIRWIAFLYATQEYQWPKISTPGIRPIKYGSFGKLMGQHRKQQEFIDAGEYEVWPFINIESYQNAKRNPVLLASS